MRGGQSPLWWGLVWLVLSRIFWPVNAQAWTRDLPGGWLHSSASLSGLMSPGGQSQESPRPGGMWLATGQTRLYGLPGLPQRFLAVGGSWGGSRPLNLRLGYQTTGQDLVQGTLLEGALDWGGAWQGGIFGRFRSSQVGGQVVALTRYVGAHAQWQGQLGSGVWSRAEIFAPLWTSANSGFKSPFHSKTLAWEICHGRVSLALIVEKGEDAQPHVDMEMATAWSPRAGFLLRASPATGAMGPGIFVARGGLLLRTSHLVHPELGTTHRVMVVFGNWAGCGL